MKQLTSIQRLARSLQAVFIALGEPVPMDVQDITGYKHAVFARHLGYPDDQAMASESLDPNVRGGWAWWATTLLLGAQGLTSEWQPIESAPKDGRWLLLRDALHMRYYAAHWCGHAGDDHPPIEAGFYHWGGYQYVPVKDAITHWAEMPR